MKTSIKGLYALAVHEGLVPAPYLDPVNIWTFGIGHAETSGLDPNPRHMPRGMPADVDAAIQQAFDLFKARIVPYERAVARAVKAPLAQHEFDALVSFHFNTGAIAKASATQVLNEGGNKTEVVRRLKLYNKAGGRVLQGLVRRRDEEGEMFLRGVYPTGPIPVYEVTANNKVGRRIRTIDATQTERYLGARPAPQPGTAPAARPEPSHPDPVTNFISWLLKKLKGDA